MSRNRLGQFVRVVAIDPGVTTGVCVLEGTLGTKFSSGWEIKLNQFDLDELFDSAVSSGLYSGLEDDWWSKCAAAGNELAWKMVSTFGEDEVDCWVMEDFLLRPSAAAQGIGGRNAVVPVAFGAAYRSALVGACAGGAWLVSMTSAKSVMDDERLYRWFGKDSFRSARAGGPGGHSRDACRHALLGVRRKKEWVD